MIRTQFQTSSPNIPLFLSALIGSELIRIVCVHTQCALTAIRIECAFGKSTSIGGLKVNCIITGINVGVIYSCVINCVRK